MTIQELIQAAKDTVITDEKIASLNHRLQLNEEAYERKRLSINEHDFLSRTYNL